MQIIINNMKFDYDLGCRLLKLKHQTCPFEQLADIWDDIVPLSFKEIAQLPNLEQRRDRKSTRLNSSHTDISRMPSSA